MKIIYLFLKVNLLNIHSIFKILLINSLTIQIIIEVEF
jgi:hypothetical protein